MKSRILFMFRGKLPKKASIDHLNDRIISKQDDVDPIHE